MPEKKKPGPKPRPAEERNDYSATINFPLEVEQAIEKFRHEYDMPPSRSAAILFGLRSFLTKKGLL